MLISLDMEIAPFQGDMGRKGIQAHQIAAM